MPSRSKSTVSGSSQVRSSVFAEPSITDTFCWAGIGQPPISVSWVVIRITPCTGDSQRSISSMACWMSDGSVDELLALARGSAPGSESMQSSEAVTVSRPARKNR